MSTLLSDIDVLTQDYVGNYSTGTTKDDIRYRAINRSIEFNKRMVGLPNDEEIYSFYFSADQLFYDLPSKVSEALYLMYNNKLANTRGNQFEYFNYPEILQGAGNTPANKWSLTGINGKKQLIISASNKYGGVTLFNLDTIAEWAASDDASGLAVDSTFKYSGAGSMSFDITDSAGVATLTATGLNLDLQDLFDKYGFIKMQSWMTDNDIDDISLKLQSSSGNYYTITITLADDGTAFIQDDWQKLGFDTQNAVATGTPDLTAITQISIEYTLGASFTSATDFRLDSIFTTYPDKMDLIHLSNIKGYAADGVTEKTTLDTATDILYYSDDYDDFTDLIAQRAAINLWPQLLGDKEAYQLLKNDYKTNLKSFARRWPRKRVQGSFRTSLRR